MANRVSQVSHQQLTMVEYIRKYKPEYSESVNDHLSPLLTHCKMLKSLYGEDCTVIFAGPCISKKREADLRGDLLHAAISFQDLELWFQQEGINLGEMVPDQSDRFLPHSSFDGASYPIEGGMLRSLEKQQVPVEPRQMLSFSNIHNMDSILKDLELLGGDSPVFLELLACEGGCINGPSCINSSGTAVKKKGLADYAESRPAVAQAYEPCAAIYFRRDIRESVSAVFEETDIQDALRKIGKYESGDEKNCGACGYSTCRDYAVACLNNRAEPDMCVSYLKTLSEKKANALIKAMPSGVVIVDSDMKIIECNRAFASMIGEEAKAAYDVKPGMKGATLEKLIPFAPVFEGVLTEDTVLTDQTFHMNSKVFTGSIFTIEKNQAAGGIFQDVTLPWVQKDQIIKQARNVMENSISTVQQIAYLLGENAAQSEIMLNSIVSSFDSEKKEDHNA
ncbi:MAG: [Fe-Fe] hydrogenase large subunit C-terminal domain-containing protein [Spirochaetales bacterium]|nr:[Fe-Fe] hydrogenase large subunit C-terminal domain-containing protein [Spirochaetales bacterium]